MWSKRTPRQEASIKSVTFQPTSEFSSEVPDSPTFPRWRTYSSTESIFSHVSDVRKETMRIKSLRRGSFNTSVRSHLSYENYVQLAALSGDDKEVKRLLSQGAEVDRKDHNGKTALQNAILSRKLAVVQVVLLAGADVTKIDERGDTPLHTAVRVGNEEIVKIFLNCPGCDVEALGHNGMTALHVAGQLDYCAIAILLTLQGASICNKGKHILTPLALAISKGSHKSVEYFFRLVDQQQLDSMQLLTDVDDLGSSALHLAVDSGNLQVVEMCLNRGACGRLQRLEDGTTPMHLACFHGYLDIVKALLDNDPNIATSVLVDEQGCTPLHRAAVNNHAEVVKYLLEKGCPVDPRDQSCHTPLLIAAANGCQETVQVLLEKGSDVALKDSNLCSALHVAIGHTNTLAALLNHPDSVAQISEKDVAGFTPLHHAVQEGNIKDTQLLVACDSYSIEVPSDYQDTSLHIAARNGFPDITHLLMEQRNERVVNAKNNQKRTALHLACTEGHELVVELLVSETRIEWDGASYTPLHLAAMNGSLKCVELVLQAHPKCLNDVDKCKNTALNLAAIAGHAHIVKFLLCVGDQLITCNLHHKNVLDLSIDYGWEHVAMVIAEHDRWQEVLHPTPMGDKTQLDILVQNLPNVVEKFLDRCISYEGHSTDSNFKIIYDLRLIQGMGLPGGNKERCNLKFLRTMAKLRRENCLGHPVCYTLMKLKWRKFGWTTFMANLTIYLMFLLLMTYVVVAMAIKGNWECPPKLPGKSSNTSTHSREDLFSCDDHKKFHDEVFAQYFLIALCIFLFSKELLELVKLRLKYLKDIANYCEWPIYMSAMFYLLPVCACKNKLQMEAAALCLLLSWINLAMYMRRSSVYGQYVVMLLSMVKTLIEVGLLLLIFMVAFAITFFIILKESHESLFPTLQKSVVKTFVMTLGELNFQSTYLKSNITYEVLNYSVFVSFCILMPIILMNMLIGLAVGDIDSIRQCAVVEQYRIQVEHLLELEESLPKWLLRRLRIKEHVEFPNKPKTTAEKLWEAVCGLGKAREDDSDHQRRIPVMLAQLKDKIDENDARTKELEKAILLQTQLLREINRQLAGSSQSTGQKLMNWFSSGFQGWGGFKFY